MSSKKYQTKVEQNGDTWSAQILRQVSSQKQHVSKQQGDFSTETEAQQWADDALQEFVSAQQKANVRQGVQRKDSAEIRRRRSARRADKTEAAKAEAEAESGTEEDLEEG